MPEASSEFDRRRWVVLAVLTLVYCLNYADRQLLSVLAEPIRKELGLSDTQLGLLTGSIFGLLYGLIGLPVAWLADRTDRTRILAIGCAVWSLFTALCGRAHTFAQLALTRGGVAIGESGGTAPSFSIISDYFPKRNRGRAIAIYMLGVPIGTSFGVTFGAWVTTAFDWRTAFMSLGIPGILVALMLGFLVPEPVRGHAEGLPQDSPAPILRTLRLMFKSRMLVFTIVGSSFAATSQLAMIVWTPAFLMRVQSVTLRELGTYYSLFTALGSVSGTLLIGTLLDRSLRVTPRAYGLIPAIAMVGTIPVFLSALFVQEPILSIILMAISQLLVSAYQVPAFAALHSVVPSAQRSIASAALLLILALTATLGGPLLIGSVSDVIRSSAGTQSLRWAFSLLTPFLCAAASLFYISSRSASHAQSSPTVS
jgi:predicted MFS family arabinose efflux permease